MSKQDNSISLTDQIMQTPTECINESAKYISCPVYGQMKNPFIDALEPVMERKELTEKLWVRPDFKEEYRDLPAHIRRTLILNLNNLFVPNDDHVLLYEKIASMIRFTYSLRNPFDPKYNQELRDILKEKNIREALGRSNDSLDIRPPGMACIGISGVGKTFGIDRCLKMGFEKVIEHVNYQDIPFIRKQIVSMRIECPYSASPKSLLLEILKKIDTLLGTRLESECCKLSATNLIRPVACALVGVGLGVLVLDEIQRLKPKNTGGGEEWLLDFLVQLSNVLKVPLVVIGTPKVQAYFEREFAVSRRLSSGGYHHYEPLPYGRKWDMFLQKMWYYQYTNIKTELTEELSKALYSKTLGIPDLAVDYFVFAQQYAISKKKEDKKITTDLLDLISRRETSLIKKFITASLEKNNKFMTEVLDFPYVSFEKNILKLSSSGSKNEKPPTGEVPESSLDDLM